MNRRRSGGTVSLYILYQRTKIKCYRQMVYNFFPHIQITWIFSLFHLITQLQIWSFWVLKLQSFFYFFCSRFNLISRCVQDQWIRLANLELEDSNGCILRCGISLENRLAHLTNPSCTLSGISESVYTTCARKSIHLHQFKNMFALHIVIHHCFVNHIIIVSMIVWYHWSEVWLITRPLSPNSTIITTK